VVPVRCAAPHDVPFFPAMAPATSTGDELRAGLPAMVVVGEEDGDELVVGTAVAAVPGVTLGHGTAAATGRGTEEATDWTVDVAGVSTGPTGVAPTACTPPSTAPPTAWATPERRPFDGRPRSGFTGDASAVVPCASLLPAAAAASATSMDSDQAQATPRPRTRNLPSIRGHPNDRPSGDDRSLRVADGIGAPHLQGSVRFLRSVIRLALAGPVTLRPHLAMGLPFRCRPFEETSSSRRSFASGSRQRLDNLQNVEQARIFWSLLLPCGTHGRDPGRTMGRQKCNPGRFTVPVGRTRRSRWSCRRTSGFDGLPLRCEHLPTSRDAFQCTLASILELDPGACHEVLHGP
jgi:hypothetical protein